MFRGSCLGRCGQLQAENPRAASRLTSLYAAHSADAFRYALHLTGRREDAEDVVQFVFLQAYRLLESGEELVTPRAWLIRATKHRSLNLIRDRRETATADIELSPAPRHDVDPAEAEALADVRSTLWALPENQHHAFVLRHWSGLSQDEIAEVLATTPGAVESLLVRARTALLRDQQEKSECVGVRRRLVEALTPTGGQEAHIAKCRRCRTARARLLHASEFAATLTLIPRPYVAHALAAAVPGFSAPSAAAAATTATGAAGGATGSGAGGGAGLATASAATKLTLATKLALAATTAVVALGAAHPVRNAVASVLLPHQPTRTATQQPKDTTPASHTASTGSATSTDGPGGAAPGQSGSHHTTKANPSHAGDGKAKGKGKSHPGGGNGKPKGTGKPATSGTNGKTHGKPASAGTNGKAKGKSGATGGSSKTATGSGKGKGKTHTTGTTATGTGKGAGTGNGKGKGKG